MSKAKKEKKVKAVSFGLGLLVFVLAFGFGAVSKVAIKPVWAKQYSVQWSENIGTLQSDLSYGEGEANTFDLYLPKDNRRDTYGLVVYLHAGGFTSGDKSDDREMLAWLCSKGYVAAGINYTLRSEEHPEASVLTQSNEIKAAVPAVIEAAAQAGYPIDKMTVAGGSAGHALAMLYAYRDAADAPVPVVFTFGGVGPSSFHREDWGCYGLDQDTEESVIATQLLFSSMLGEMLTAEEVRDGSYLEKMHPISASEFITPDAPPTVVAYGSHDRIQAFPASLRLKAALEESNVDFRYFELPHSGHGLQNDDAVQRQYMEAVEAYLDQYMPVE